MAQADSSTNGKQVVLIQFALVLNAQIELIAGNGGGIDLGERIDVGVAVGNSYRLGVLAPEIRDVSTDGEAFHHFPSKAQISLAETTVTVLCHIEIATGQRLSVIVVSGIIVITYI